MGIAKLNHKNIEDSNNNPMDTIDLFFTEELIIGICGQLGTDLSKVSEEIRDILTTDFKYECEEIKLSDIIFESFKKSPPPSKYERITKGMDYGDELRKKEGNVVLAKKAISKLALDRLRTMDEKEIADRNFRSRRKCVVINSIKHPDELLAFEKVYGSNFYLLGVFSSQDSRESNLKNSFGRSHTLEVVDLMRRDDNSEIKNGQKFRKVFVQSDYFINDISDLNNKIERFINLIFDVEITTPTLDENAMYQAMGASANSACLSRQVGACITDTAGNILSLGWNDVPKSGGGVYLEGAQNDKRCKCSEIKKCSNTNKKNIIVKNMVKDLSDKGIVNISKKTTVNIIEETESIIKNNGIKDLLEFSRSIHAEMHAIILGSQKTGSQMINGKLYCTTYPCHNCARHIIFAGIKEVYYIEPYSKSLCLELHSDAITEHESDSDKVRIMMYEGVAPKSFIKFYQLISDNRKHKVSSTIDKKRLRPKHQAHLEALFERETHFVRATKIDFLNKND